MNVRTSTICMDCGVRQGRAHLGLRCLQCGQRYAVQMHLLKVFLGSDGDWFGADDMPPQSC